MTITELEQADKAFISVYDAAELMECDPQKLRDALDIDDERPMEMRRFLFPHCKVGNRRRISRTGFLEWYKGEMNPFVAIWKMKNGMKGVDAN